MRSIIFILSFMIFSISAFSQSSPKEIVDMGEIIPGLKTDVKYSTTDNFTKQKLYTVGKAYGSLSMAQTLKVAGDSLAKKGLGIKIFDAYRPRIVQWLLWEIVPDPTFVADPSSGSLHNRGAAVDLTLYDLQTGNDLAMPTPFDDFTERASQSYMNLPENVIANRKMLRDLMVKYGFQIYDAEWWHYEHTNSRRYPLKDFQMR